MSERMPIAASDWFMQLHEPVKGGARGSHTDYWVCPVCQKKFGDLNSAVACIVLQHLPQGKDQVPPAWGITQPYCWCGEKINLLNPNYIEEFKRHTRTCPAFHWNLKEAAVLTALSHLS